MGEAGVNLVTVGVFAWSRLQPRPGPAPWRELLGLRVEEFAPLPQGATVRLEGEAFYLGTLPDRRAASWCSPRGTDVSGRAAAHDVAGAPRPADGAPQR